ncbi:hypothetical protein LTR22_009871 [Elasticomyces elasticus]|nr:hypothetical protein LTR22_009871 [Elasticomyces elasticus]
MMRELEAAAKMMRELEAAAKMMRELEAAAKMRSELEAAAKVMRELEAAAKMGRELEAAAKARRELEDTVRARRELEGAEKARRGLEATASKPNVAGGTELDPNTIDLTDDENEGEKQTSLERRPTPTLKIYDLRNMDETRNLQPEVFFQISLIPQARRFWSGSVSVRSGCESVNCPLNQDDMGEDEDGYDEITPSAGANLVKKHLAKPRRTDDELCEEAREFWEMEKDGVRVAAR